jgi:hypothetical protein
MGPDWTLTVRRRVARVSLRPATTAVLFVLVVVAMIAAAVFLQKSADVHRRAQLLAVQVRASTQEMSAVKWRANSEVLAGTANFSGSGLLVRDGVAVIAQLSTEVAQLRSLQPGADSKRLARDVEQVYLSGLQQLALGRGPKPLSRATLARMQDSFQPLLDRMDLDAQRTAKAQQAVAAEAVERSLVASIGSLLLGVGRWSAWVGAWRGCDAARS